MSWAFKPCILGVAWHDSLSAYFDVLQKLMSCTRVSAHYSCTNVHSSLKFVNFEVWSTRVWYKFLHIEVRFTRVQYKFALHSPLLFFTFSTFEPYNPNFPQLVGVGRFSVLVLSTAWMQILVMAPRCWRFKLY
jgi:hypothetical protein